MKPLTVFSSQLCQRLPRLLCYTSVPVDEGAGTDEETLIRILVTRAEVGYPATCNTSHQLWEKYKCRGYGVSPGRSCAQSTHFSPTTSVVTLCFCTQATLILISHLFLFSKELNQKACRQFQVESTVPG